MKLELTYNKELVEVDFDPRKVTWKSQNFGQYSYKGFTLSELDKPVFIKRHRVPPESWDLLCDLRDQGSPSPYIPTIYGFYEFEGTKDGFTSYIVMEMVKGTPLLEKIKKVKNEDCYEIMRSTFFALEAIIGKDHWYPDLDFQNIVFHKRGRLSGSHLIDIDSCLPDSTMFVDFLKNRGAHTNVNERYWGCVVPMAKERGNFKKLSGKTVTQAAFVYFAIDLYFKTCWTDNPFNLKSQDIFKLMKNSSSYIDESTQDIWWAIHEELVENPVEGCEWELLDDFAISLFGFEQALNPLVEDSQGILDMALGLVDRLFSFLKGYNGGRKMIKNFSCLFTYIPIIVISAMDDPEDIKKGLEAGADEYVVKPVDGVALAARTNSMLRLKEKYDHLMEAKDKLSDHAHEINQLLNESLVTRS